MGAWVLGVLGALYGSFALAGPADMAKDLPGKWVGRTFNGNDECAVTIKLVISGFLRRREYLEITVAKDDDAMTYRAQVATLERTLQEGHHGQGVAIDERYSGILEVRRKYALLQFHDEGKLSGIALDHTVSDPIFVKRSHHLDCGGLVKQPVNTP